MTALHYAVQNFYNYREEPLNLIKKLLDCGANLEAENNEMRTPVMLADKHSRQGNVMGGENLQELLQQRLADAVSVNSDTIRSEATPKVLQSVTDPDAAKTMHTPQPNPSARDASSIAVLTRGFGFVSQSAAGQRAQLGMDAADSVDQKNDCAKRKI